MKGLSSFVSEAILLVLVISGTALIVSNIVPSMLHVGNGLTSDNGEIRVSYIMYSNGYIYAYNYGDPINVSTPVEAYIDNGWKNTTIIDHGMVFRIRSNSPEAFLETNNGVVVLKP